MSLTEATPTSNGDIAARSRAEPRDVSTYEALRLAVLDEIARSKVDGRDRDAVAAVVRAHVDSHQRSAEAGSGRRFSKPSEIVERLIRSICGAGPFEKYFTRPDLADEVNFKKDVITYFTRDGRQKEHPVCAQTPPQPIDLPQVELVHHRVVASGLLHIDGDQ